MKIEKFKNAVKIFLKQWKLYLKHSILQEFKNKAAFLVIQSNKSETVLDLQSFCEKQPNKTN